MTVGERFIKYLDDNPQASVQVVEGKLTKLGLRGESSAVFLSFESVSKCQ